MTILHHIVSIVSIVSLASNIAFKSAANRDREHTTIKMKLCFEFSNTMLQVMFVMYYHIVHVVML